MSTINLSHRHHQPLPRVPVMGRDHREVQYRPMVPDIAPWFLGILALLAGVAAVRVGWAAVKWWMEG